MDLDAIRQAALKGQLVLGTWSDPEGAKAAKEEGMARVDRNADEVWKFYAYSAVEQCAEHMDTFTSDDVTDHIPDYVVTHENRALGPVMLKAARDGLIVKTGTVRNSTRRSLHSSPRTVWRKA